MLLGQQKKRVWRPKLSPLGNIHGFIPEGLSSTGNEISRHDYGIPPKKAPLISPQRDLGAGFLSKNISFDPFTNNNFFYRRSLTIPCGPINRLCA
jgi:hypothetical protein